MIKQLKVSETVGEFYLQYNSKNNTINTTDLPHNSLKMEMLNEKEEYDHKAIMQHFPSKD